MKAVLLAGGLGTRMRPLTYLVPKPLLPIGGKPLIERTIEYLKVHGFSEFVICVAYLKGYIIDYLNKNKNNLDIEIEFAESDVPLGTAGQLKTAERFISDTFLAMNGDIVTSLNVRRLIDFHERRGGIGTIALKKFEFKIPYGLVDVGQDSQIVNFREKPPLSFMVNAGIYVFERELFDYIPKGKVSSLETDIFPRLISEGKSLNSFYEEAYWADIGTVSDFEKADADMLLRDTEHAWELK